MTRRVFVAVAALGLAACGSSGAKAPPTPRAHSCGPRSAKTIAADPVARVYRSGDTVYGCSSRTGRRTTLGQTSISAKDRTRLGLVRLAGSYAAFASSTFGVDSGGAEVSVVRLSDGRRVRTGQAVDQGLVESVQSVPSLVVRSDGAVAWIGQVRSIIGRGEQLEVHRADRRGAALLDRGADIAPRSLRLRGRRLSWRDGSSTRTSTLR